MKTSFFTVIIPTFNSERTLAKAISSVLSQTFDNFEILVVDGASTDNTNSIVSRFGEERITYISEPDKGIYDAMNKGVVIAKGEWLYFLGSDDYLWDAHVLKDVFQYTQRVETDFIYGNVFSPDLGEDYDGEFDLVKLVKQNICHQAVFCRRYIFNKIGLFDINYAVLGDHDFTIRCFQNAEIAKSYFERRIAYYAPSGASRGVDRIQLIKDRYLIASTLSKDYPDRQQLAEVYRSQANHLLGVIGIRNFVLGKARTTVKTFLPYDPHLRRRMLVAIWDRMLSKIL